MDILNFVKEHCEKHNINFKTSDSFEIEYPESDGTCAGYFTLKNNKPELGVALGAGIWEMILLHELCHSKQWLENAKPWRDGFLTEKECKEFGFDYDGAEGIDIIDLWTEFKIELVPEQLNNIINRAIDLERDCEIRTCELASELIENFNKEQYIKQSNTYLRFYKFVQKNRRWGISSSPAYQDDQVLVKQASTFNLDYFAPLSKSEEDVFLDYIKRHES